MFCGFLAEYQLEHKIEKNRERQYIKSFIEDLQADIINFKDKVDFCELTINRSDSIIKLLNLTNKEKVAGDIYYFLRWMPRSDFFIVNDRTIIQLRNAGGMRLISNKPAADSITNYYKFIDFIEKLYEEQLQHRRSLRPLLPSLLNGNDYGLVINEKNDVIRSATPLKLKETDRNTIDNFLVVLHNIKSINITLRNNVLHLQAKAKGIITSIKKEYHLQ